MFLTEHLSSLGRLRAVLLKALRVVILIPITLYFLGYQPTLAIPPIKKSVAFAQFTQEQKIEALSFSTGLNTPHQGYVSTRYSNYHPGVDIAASLGVEVHPILDGKVREVSLGFFGLGHFVVIEHEQGLKSTYGHLGKVFVAVGQKVKADDAIAQVGMTGRTSGPHTHLEITHQDKYIDPVKLIDHLPLNSHK